MQDCTQARIGDKSVGGGAPVFVIAEIGINHNGSIELAKRLIDGAVLAGADAVKFQKRTPEKCVPRDQWNVERDTPWGRLTYIDYRRRIELGARDYSVNSYLNNQTAVGMAVLQRPGTNALATAAEIGRAHV